jgi:uncharacterized protein with PQ loop repeat
MATLFAIASLLALLSFIPIVIFHYSRSDKVSSVALLAFTILFGAFIVFAGAIHGECIRGD